MKSHLYLCVVELVSLFCIAGGFLLQPHPVLETRSSATSCRPKTLGPDYNNPEYGALDPTICSRMRRYRSTHVQKKRTEIQLFRRNSVSGADNVDQLRPTLVERLRRALFRLTQVWYSIRKAIRAKLQKFTVYVLECENGKYYVGSTSHKRQRLQQHATSRGGSKWTRLHKPLRVDRIYKRVPEEYYLGLEAKVTAQYMLEYGVNNVRGAMFAQTRAYTENDLDALTGFLGHYNDLNYGEVYSALQQSLPRPSSSSYQQEVLVPENFQPKTTYKKRIPLGKDVCRKCGLTGHWAATCPTILSARCYNCGQQGHFAADCPSMMKEDFTTTTMPIPTEKCYACGKIGHFARDCPEVEASTQTSEEKCYACGKTGHYAKDCPDWGNRCYSCGARGHFAADCPQKSSSLAD